MGLNPALLAIPTERPFEISVFPVTSFGVGAGPSYGQLNTISGAFTGDTTLSDSVRANIIDLLFSNKLSGRADARLFGAEYSTPDFGGLALTWTLHAAVRTFLPDTLLNFFGQDALANLIQNPLPRISSMDVQGLWYSDYALSYGRNLITATGDGGVDLGIGVSAKYVAGIAYARLDPASYISINSPQNQGATTYIRLKYRLQFAYADQFDPNHLPNGFSFDLLTSATAGSGFGADGGLTLSGHSENGAAPWRIGVSVTDIGSIRWTKHTDARYNIDTVVVAHLNDASKALNDSLRALGGVLDTTDAPFTSSLPTTLHIAASLDLAGLGIAPAGLQLSAAAEYAKGLTDVVGAPKNGRLGAAFILERPSETFSFHGALGFTTQDGTTDLTIAAGIGLWNRVLLDAGTSGLTNLFKSDGTSDVALSLKVLF